MAYNKKLCGNIVDVRNEEIHSGEILIEGRKIKEVKEKNSSKNIFLLPGLIDAHVHIESSMLCPSRFGEACIPHGTTCVIADPHEIANVMGMDGIFYMMNDFTPLKIFFTAPSCVPASSYDRGGAVIGLSQIKKLLRMENVVALGEVMDYPAVLSDGEIVEKIKVARKEEKKIDGHAPGLQGDELKKYISYGISTDHECTTIAEAKEKIKAGMKVMIRHGSSAKNLKDLIGLDYDRCFLVTDDIHPDDLLNGHMNKIVQKAIEYGIEPIKAIKMATLNPAEHYGLNIGSLEVGKKADIVEVTNLNKMDVSRVFIDGKLVAKDGKYLFKVTPKKIGTHIKIKEVKEKHFRIPCRGKEVGICAIEIIANQILTKKVKVILSVANGDVTADIKQDVIKVAVVNRYGSNNIGIGFVKGFGMKRGAIATTIAHDSHNIIVIGVSNKKMADAVNIVAKNGGIVVVDEKVVKLELPIAGLMSCEKADKVASQLKNVFEYAQQLGCNKDAIRSLSFLSLLVIPEIRISDKGIFDVAKQKFISVFVE